jgi:hypothetical protein
MKVTGAALGQKQQEKPGTRASKELRINAVAEGEPVMARHGHNSS